jgi:hypothetical protein
MPGGMNMLARVFRGRFVSGDAKTVLVGSFAIPVGVRFYIFVWLVLVFAAAMAFIAGHGTSVAHRLGGILFCVVLFGFYVFLINFGNTQSRAEIKFMTEKIRDAVE